MTDKKPEDLHQPVLLDAVRQALTSHQPRRLCDVTVGMGGHSLALLEACPEATLHALDRDPKALELTRQRLHQHLPRLSFQQGTFESLEYQAGSFDALLADLGCSSLQLDDPERGFSFRFGGPLDMRMGPDVQRSAADLIKDCNEEELANWIYQYGDEPASRKIAAAIVRARKLSPIETTTELASIIRQHARAPRRGKGQKSIDPATRSFQALRIVVNDELGLLDRSLPKFLDALAPGGRLAIISFHSLEDRRVKTCFRQWTRENLGRALTSKPITAESEETARNPRARSARLRVFEKAHVS